MCLCVFVSTPRSALASTSAGGASSSSSPGVRGSVVAPAEPAVSSRLSLPLPVCQCMCVLSSCDCVRIPQELAAEATKLRQTLSRRGMLEEYVPKVCVCVCVCLSAFFLPFQNK